MKFVRGVEVWKCAVMWVSSGEMRCRIRGLYVGRGDNDITGPEDRRHESRVGVVRCRRNDLD